MGKTQRGLLGHLVTMWVNSLNLGFDNTASARVHVSVRTTRHDRGKPNGEYLFVWVQSGYLGLSEKTTRSKAKVAKSQIHKIVKKNRPPVFPG